MKLTTPVVAKLVGASPRRIRYWADKNLLRPSAKQTGHRLYTFQDVLALRTICALREGGCPLQHIRRVVKELRQRFADETTEALARLTLLTDGQRVFIVDEDDAHEVLSGQVFMRVIQLGPIIAETRQRARTLRFQWVESVRASGQPYSLTVAHDPEGDCYTVQCRELPGAIEQGATAEEAIENGMAAIVSVLEFMARRGDRRGGARVVRA